MCLSCRLEPTLLKQLGVQVYSDNSNEQRLSKIRNVVVVVVVIVVVVVVAIFAISGTMS